MGKYVELNLTKKIHTPEFFPNKIWLVFKVTEKKIIIIMTFMTAYKVKGSSVNSREYKAIR